jgi:hypothetical protein
VEKKEYEAPVVVQLGGVRDLTAVNKCGGSGDSAYPQLLSSNFTSDGCTPSP